MIAFYYNFSFFLTNFKCGGDNMNILCKNWVSNRFSSNHRGNFMVRRTLMLSAIIIASCTYSAIIHSGPRRNLDRETESIRSNCNPDFLREVLKAHKKDPNYTTNLCTREKNALVPILLAAFQCPGAKMTKVALTESGVGLAGKDNSLVNIAADSGNLDALKTVVEDYSQDDARSCVVSAASWELNGYTPLSLSVLRDNLPMAQYLVNKGAKLNQWNHTSPRNGYQFKGVPQPKCRVALGCAFEKNNPKMVEFLLQKGATASEDDLHYTEGKLRKCALKFGKDDPKCKARQEVFTMLKKMQQQWWGGLSKSYAKPESCCNNLYHGENNSRLQ